MSKAYVAVIVDNSSTARKTLGAVLRQHFTIRDTYSCGTAREAIAVIRQTPEIDWVFCDSDIADQKWNEFINDAKNEKSLANAKFILLSSESKRETLLAAASLGVGTFILKPFTPKTIVEKMRKLADGKSQRKSKRVPLLEAFEAQVEFKQAKYKSVLIDISLGGCMLKSPLYKKGGIIYDKARIHIPFEKSKISLKSQLIRIERDLSTPEAKLVQAAYVFEDVKQESAKQLTEFLAKIKTPGK